jgi:hypothetical protein
VLEGRGDGAFADPVYFTGLSALNLATGDYNKDHRPDFAVFSGGTATTLQSVLNTTLFLGPEPKLSWTRFGALSRLVWYTNYAGYTLEYRATLAPNDSWTNAPGQSTPLDCQYYYTISSNRPGFYRLHHP